MSFKPPGFEQKQEGGQSMEKKKSSRRKLKHVYGGVVEQYRGYLDEKPEFIRTGFQEIDEVIGGFVKGEYSVVAGATGSGKSSFALQVGSHVADAQKIPTLVLSFEMTGEMIVTRHIASDLGIPVKRQITGDFTREEFDRIEAGMANVSENIAVVDRQLTIEDASEEIRIAIEEDGIQFIIIDYLGLFEGDKGVGRVEEVSRISRGIKKLVLEHKIAALVVSQFSREVSKREDKRPTLSDLRDSGQIENDAAVAFLIYRDDYYNRDSREPGIAEINIAKNRYGEPQKIIKLGWNGPQMRFYSNPNIPKNDAPPNFGAYKNKKDFKSFYGDD